MIEIDRDIPAPLAAPPRLASSSMLIPITETALKAETNTVSCLRAHTPHMLNRHATHALLEVPHYGTGFRREYADQRYLDSSQFTPPSSANDNKYSDFS
jgi:hypothetical protein